MASLAPLPPPNPPPLPPKRSKTPIRIPSSFSKIPSWVSLNPSASSLQTNPDQKGLLENLHLVSLSKQGRFHEAREFLLSMDSFGIPVDTHFYNCLFEACRAWKSLPDARIFHDHMVNKGGISNPDVSVWNCILRMYFDCLGFEDARRTFAGMPDKSLDSWRVMISSYAQNGLYQQAIALLYEMKLLGFTPDSSILASLLRSCSTCSRLKFGRQIHSLAIRIGLVVDAPINTELVSMYVKCGCLESSKLLLEMMTERNIACWTTLMVGYTRAGKQVDALDLLCQMMWEGSELDLYVFSIALKACCGLEDWQAGRQIHGRIVKLGMDSDVSGGTPIVDFYINFGSIDDACRAFKRIYEPNEVAWSALMSGFSRYGKFEVCLEMFQHLRSRGVALNPNIYTSLFQVSSGMADPNSGTQLHADAIKRGLVSELYGESALVTMYSRCGYLEYARKAFELIEEPDAVAWTAILAGYAYHGQASKAFEIFDEMQSCGIKPNSLTFTGILTACSHTGLVSKARQVLDSMSEIYGVEPTVDHYNCMIDVYCRAGQLEESFALIKSRAFQPDAMSWKILLGGCAAHWNVELGKIAGEILIQKEPMDSAAYILTFNMYTSAGRWQEAALIRKMMSERGIKKEVSCSWITVKGKVHRFIVGDRHHPLSDQIYSKLNELETSVSFTRNALQEHKQSNGLIDERRDQLLDHSERLAISFGLLSVPDNCPVLVFKNLRVCSDCHEFTKLVSSITGRLIVVRDSSRFHHFKHGMCSCNDYW